MHVGADPALTTVESAAEVKASFERLRREDTKEGMLREMSGKMLKRPGADAFLYVTARLSVCWKLAMMIVAVSRVCPAGQRLRCVRHQHVLFSKWTPIGVIKMLLCRTGDANAVGRMLWGRRGRS